MRILLKGGVWKNTEDEILKAAVMKYGLNQWARISSLLVRKSAKQCKARWYSWLDPSIKKTEWSKEEDEKLLHLAKIMPNQWHTIAPIVGRTAYQCLERYEKLLDAAQHQDDEDYDPSEDPRRLMPGEIHPNPETKAPLPDPIDMDEDEKEMLSEARARLMNTRGKKAKRKAREKQLMEARRLAYLQKKRELRAAGIEMPSRRRRKRKGIDYNKEIPFYKKPAPGFFDTSVEQEKKEDDKKKFKQILLSNAEGKRRDEEEARQRKKDLQIEKKNKEKNLPSVVLQMNQSSKGSGGRRRLTIPSPTIDDQQLEHLAKLGVSEAALTDEELVGKQQATKGLLPSYERTPLTPSLSRSPFPGSSTPSRRTPLRTPQQTDRIANDVKYLSAMASASTPLLGEEDLSGVDESKTDFKAATPSRVQIKTPNPLLASGGSSSTPAANLTLSSTRKLLASTRSGNTPSRALSAASSSSTTPSRGNSNDGGAAAAAAVTPLRDQLKLNSSALQTEDLFQLTRQLKSKAKSIKEGLASLPEAQYEYNIELPEAPKLTSLTEDEKDGRVLDGDQVDHLKKQQQQQLKRRRLLESSLVLQEKLTLPSRFNSNFSLCSVKASTSCPLSPSLEKQITSLLQREFSALVKNDLSVPSADQKRLPPITLPQLQQARSLISKELASEPSTSSPHLLNIATRELAQTIAQFQMDSVPKEKLSKKPLLDSTKMELVSNAEASKQTKVSDLQLQYKVCSQEVKVLSKKATKIQNRLNMLHGGYTKIGSDLNKQIQELYLELDTSNMQLVGFNTLRQYEMEAAPARIDKLKEEVDKMKKIENNLQKRYYNLVLERDSLVKAEASS